MRTVKAGFKDYTLHSVTGRVANTSKNLETRVHGGGGGGSTYQGTGYAAPVTISSTTTVHDQIFLIDSEGKEHSFQLADFDIACREGNELTVIWSIKQGNKTGEYIVVHNQTTSKTFFNIGALRRMFKPPWYFLLGAIILCFVVLSGGTAVVAAFAAVGAWVFITIQGANKFKSDFQPHAYA
jgi:hypothetical protein